MKTIYHIYSDKDGECQGMFDESEVYLDGWFCDDANWRNEYFSGFMEKLGLNVVTVNSGAQYKRLEKKLLKELQR